MLLYLEHFKIFLFITGLRNFERQRFDKVMKEPLAEDKEFIQFFDASCISGVNHLLFSTVNALKAFENKTNISKKLAVELLLHASGQRQIDKAISMIGVKPETKSIILVLMGSEKSQLIASLNKIAQFVKGEVDDTIVTSTDKAKLEKLRNIYKITPLEINSKIYYAREATALEELIIERVAMLGIKHN